MRKMKPRLTRFIIAYCAYCTRYPGRIRSGTDTESFSHLEQREDEDEKKTRLSRVPTMFPADSARQRHGRK